MYRIERTGDVVNVRRLSDGACIPVDPPRECVDQSTGRTLMVGGNQDYAGYLAWVAAGNEAEVVDLKEPRTVGELRRERYDASGATTHEMIVALWEMVVENRPDSAHALQAVRERVKQDLPKSK